MAIVSTRSTRRGVFALRASWVPARSEEATSELPSRRYLLSLPSGGPSEREAVGGRCPPFRDAVLGGDLGPFGVAAQDPVPRARDRARSEDRRAADGDRLDPLDEAGVDCIEVDLGAG